MSGSLSKKRREGREAVYPLAVSLEPCPACDARVGDKCTEQFGGEVIFRRTPHARRIESAKRRDV